MSGTGAETDAASPGLYGLLWAVKPSFIKYVSRMPDGKAYLTGGVAVNANNELLFHLDEDAATDGSSSDSGAESGAAEHTFTFRGAVQFRAHLGMLSVRLISPQVHLLGTDGELTVVDPDSAQGDRLRLVTFTVIGPALRDGTQYWAAEDVRLTAEGVPLFGDVYQAAEPFAPLMMAVPSRPPAATHGDHHD